MIYNTYYLDSEFNFIDKLKWYPWVGENYQLSANNKMLVIGESHYMWEEDGVEDIINSKYFTRNYIYDIVLRNLKNVKHVSKTHRGFERAFYQVKDVNEIHANELWSNVCYQVLVQKTLSGIQERPDYIDFYEGWYVISQLHKYLKFDSCIVFGVSSYQALFDMCKESNINIYHNDIKDPVGNVRAKIVKIELGGKPVEFIFIKHPGRYFSWMKWGSFLKKKLTN